MFKAIADSNNKLVALVTRLDRLLTRLRRRHPFIRKAVPKSLRVKAFKLRSAALTKLDSRAPIYHKCGNTNVYHCCVHKTGSQWIMSLLSDPLTYQCSGLTHFHYQTQLLGGGDKRNISDREFTDPFPERTIVSPLYITFDNFMKMPKPADYRTFFVTRNLREIVVSWYFSTKFNHLADKKRNYPVYKARQDLMHLSERDGLMYAIDRLEMGGAFDAIASWTEAADSCDRALIVRYEDLVSQNQFAVFRRLFEFLDIAIPDRSLRLLLEAYSFQNLSGRKPGKENVHSHLRSGGAETWKKHFDPAVDAHFHEVANKHGIDAENLL